MPTSLRMNCISDSLGPGLVLTGHGVSVVPAVQQD